MAPTTKQSSEKNTDYTKNYEEQVTGIEPYKQQFGQDYGNLMSAYQGIQSNQPTLNYTDPNNFFSQGFNPIIQNAISKGNADIISQRSAADRSLASSLGTAGTGDNSALLSVLRGQGRIADAGASNALYAPALAQQREFDVQNQGLINAQNTQKLQDYGARLAGLQPGMDLLTQLQNIMKTAAGRKVTESGNERSTGSSKTRKSFF